MLIPYSPSAEPFTRLADRTVKQISPFTEIKVWTMPGRANRPISHPVAEVRPLGEAGHTHSYALCSMRCLETPPEEMCVVRGADGGFECLDAVAASTLFDTVAEFRRVPNLFEILSFDYWHINYSYEIPDAAHERMETYPADPVGVGHVERMTRTKLAATGTDLDSWDSMDERTRHTFLAAFSAGGHDVIIDRHHFTDNTHDTTGLAGSGMLSMAEHRACTRSAVHAIRSLHEVNRWVRYVAVFQSWLRPAGASLDHLHKQLIDIDEYGVTSQPELQKARASPSLYNEMAVDYAVHQGPLVANNEHAVAFARPGRYYPTLEVYLTSAMPEPWLMNHEKVDAASDLAHALRVATGVDVPSNEGWHHKLLDVDQPIPWHTTLEWRVSTLAGSEGGTKVYFNTTGPWTLYNRVMVRLEDLWIDRFIAPMVVGEECPTTPNRLLYNPALIVRP